MRQKSGLIMLATVMLAVCVLVGVGSTTAQTPEWQLSIKRMTEESPKPAYTIKVSQPALDAPSGKADAFNSAVGSFITKAVEDFKQNAADAESAPDPAGTTSSLEIVYDAYITPQDRISVRFTTSFYIQGAAHPGSTSYSLTYDVQAGKVLDLAELFQPGADYLAAIANYAVAELQKQNRLEFPAGAEPRSENYAVWNLDRGGILITFDAYQVGPYAQGPSEVLVPYAALAPILRSPM